MIDRLYNYSKSPASSASGEQLLCAPFVGRVQNSQLDEH